MGGRVASSKQELLRQVRILAGVLEHQTKAQCTQHLDDIANGRIGSPPMVLRCCMAQGRDVRLIVQREAGVFGRRECHLNTLERYKRGDVLQCTRYTVVRAIPMERDPKPRCLLLHLP